MWKSGGTLILWRAINRKNIIVYSLYGNLFDSNATKTQLSLVKNNEVGLGDIATLTW